MLMPAKKPTGEDPNELVPMNFRAPKWLGERLDKWVEDMNQRRRWPKMTRPNLMRGVLEWAAEARPDWEAAVRGAQVQDAPGRAQSPESKEQEGHPGRIVVLDDEQAEPAQPGKRKR